jgi:hypothetical protein
MHRDRMFSNKSILIKTSKSGELATSEVSHNLQFWLLLIFGVLSLICSFFIIYRYLSNRTMRHGLNNHSILLLIIINVLLIFTDVSWMLDSLRHSGYVPSATKAFCLIWWFIDDSLYSIQTVILAWASIERHILIFHSKYLTTKKQKIFYHYLPPMILMIYVFSFHASVLIFPPCENEFQFNVIECGSDPCYLGIQPLAIWDTVVNSVFPTLIIAIFNIALLYRVIAQKKRLRQPIQWRKHRRMSVQLLSLSAVYLFLNLPMTIIILIQLIQRTDPEVGFGAQLYIFFLTYSVTLSLPFVVCLNYLSLDGKRRHIKISPTITLIPYKRTVAIDQ